MIIQILKIETWPLIGLISVLALSFNAKAAADSPARGRYETGARTFAGKGVVLELIRKEQTVVIRHEAIPNYMAAMTMPFKARDKTEWAGLKRGDEITFRLHVTETDSWVDGIKRIGTVSLPESKTPLAPKAAAPIANSNPLLYYQFTNELGHAVSLNDFRGQALAVTFFYTRCPLPNACPRLSENFEAAEHKIEAITNAPANWHFISISFDPAFDTPAVLKSYAESHDYDPNHWSFLTGPPEKIRELARACGLIYDPDNGTITHNFRTLIVNAAGHLQMVFPMSGDLSDQIVGQIIKAAEVTNRTIVSR
ncbi:MAG: SCO family protein [Verrucomicrobia bacterium]|nr:SCO family protein [Verrucomicrobiota bacterium]MDE3099454.1 SCO family protein [Verrucomicrobiota bacterium]